MVRLYTRGIIEAERLAGVRVADDPSTASEMITRRASRDRSRLLNSRSRSGILRLALSLPLLAGCDLPLGGCPGWVRNAVEVEVRDSITGMPAAHGSSGSVRDGPYVDSLVTTGWSGHPDSTTALILAAALERPGRYAVFVRKPGYRDWERQGVEVRREGCGVRPVRVHANLRHE